MMGRYIHFEKLLVVDLEATCWEDNKASKEPMEIIEVGFCLIDMVDYTISDPQSIIVKPLKSKVSKFCTDLTGHTQEEVDKGVSLKAAGKILKEVFKSKKYVWGSWGEYDRFQYQKECLGTDWYPFSNRHINLKTLFALHNNLKKEMGLARALRSLDYEFEGRHHNGGDDAYNTARVALTYLKKGE